MKPLIDKIRYQFESQVFIIIRDQVSDQVYYQLWNQVEWYIWHQFQDTKKKLIH